MGTHHEHRERERERAQHGLHIPTRDMTLAQTEAHMTASSGTTDIALWDSSDGTIADYAEQPEVLSLQLLVLGAQPNDFVLHLHPGIRALGRRCSGKRIGRRSGGRSGSGSSGVHVACHACCRSAVAVDQAASADHWRCHGIGGGDSTRHRIGRARCIGEWLEHLGAPSFSHGCDGASHAAEGSAVRRAAAAAAADRCEGHCPTAEAVNGWRAGGRPFGGRGAPRRWALRTCPATQGCSVGRAATTGCAERGERHCAATEPIANRATAHHWRRLQLHQRRRREPRSLHAGRWRQLNGGTSIAHGWTNVAHDQQPQWPQHCKCFGRRRKRFPASMQSHMQSRLDLPSFVRATCGESRSPVLSPGSKEPRRETGPAAMGRPPWGMNCTELALCCRAARGPWRGLVRGTSPSPWPSDRGIDPPAPPQHAAACTAVLRRSTVRSFGCRLTLPDRRAVPHPKFCG